MPGRVSLGQDGLRHALGGWSCLDKMFPTPRAQGEPLLFSQQMVESAER